jgi:outer membrane immunogenic protein
MRTILVMAGCGLLSSSAFAADLSSPPPPPTPVPVPVQRSWTGFYVGGNLDWDWGSSNSTTTNLNTGVVRSGSGSGYAFGGGGHFGYDYMLPSNLVLGGGADFVWHGDASTTAGNAAGTYSVTNQSADRVNGQVNGRLGYAFGDLMPYLTGGWAWSNASQSRTQNLGRVGAATPGVTDQASVFANGFDVGLGLEYRFWGNWSVYGQYTYNQYAPYTRAFSQAGVSTTAKASVDTLETGVNFRF